MEVSKVYWENKGEIYKFSKDKNYLIYFKGCFCCPTRGHFDTIKRFLDLGTNIYVMVHQIGSEKRHGIPYFLNRKIWQIYIDELLPKERVYLIPYHCIHDMLSEKILEDIDQVVWIRGDENNEQQFNINIYKNIINELAERGIGMDFYYTSRPLAETLSASEFIHNLLKYKYRKNICHRSCQYERLEYFLPKGLSDKQINWIIYSLLKYDLH